MFVIAGGVALPIGQIDRRLTPVAGILRRATVPSRVEVDGAGILDRGAFCHLVTRCMAGIIYIVMLSFIDRVGYESDDLS